MSHVDELRYMTFLCSIVVYIPLKSPITARLVYMSTHIIGLRCSAPLHRLTAGKSHSQAKSTSSLAVQERTCVSCLRQNTGSLRRPKKCMQACVSVMRPFAVSLSSFYALHGTGYSLYHVSVRTDLLSPRGSQRTQKQGREGKRKAGGKTHYKLNVKSPLIDAFNSISISKFASRLNFNPS